MTYLGRRLVVVVSLTLIRLISAETQLAAVKAAAEAAAEALLEKADQTEKDLADQKKREEAQRQEKYQAELKKAEEEKNALQEQINKMKDAESRAIEAESKAKKEAKEAKKEADDAKKEAEIAKSEAEVAESEAKAGKSEAEIAKPAKQNQFSQEDLNKAVEKAKAEMKEQLEKEQRLAAAANDKEKKARNTAKQAAADAAKQEELERKLKRIQDEVAAKLAKTRKRFEKMKSVAQAAVTSRELEVQKKKDAAQQLRRKKLGEEHLLLRGEQYDESPTVEVNDIDENNTSHSRSYHTWGGYDDLPLPMGWTYTFKFDKVMTIPDCWPYSCVTKTYDENAALEDTDTDLENGLQNHGLVVKENGMFNWRPLMFNTLIGAKVEIDKPENSLTDNPENSLLEKNDQGGQLQHVRKDSSVLLLEENSLQPFTLNSERQNNEFSENENTVEFVEYNNNQKNNLLKNSLVVQTSENEKSDFEECNNSRGGFPPIPYSDGNKEDDIVCYRTGTYNVTIVFTHIDADPNNPQEMVEKDEIWANSFEEQGKFIEYLRKLNGDETKINSNGSIGRNGLNMIFNGDEKVNNNNHGKGERINKINPDTFTKLDENGNIIEEAGENIILEGGDSEPYHFFPHIKIDTVRVNPLNPTEWGEYRIPHGWRWRWKFYKNFLDKKDLEKNWEGCTRDFSPSNRVDLVDRGMPTDKNGNQVPSRRLSIELYNPNSIEIYERQVYFQLNTPRMSASMIKKRRASIHAGFGGAVITAVNRKKNENSMYNLRGGGNGFLEYNGDLEKNQNATALLVESPKAVESSKKSKQNYYPHWYHPYVPMIAVPATFGTLLYLENGGARERNTRNTEESNVLIKCTPSRVAPNRNDMLAGAELPGFPTPWRWEFVFKYHGVTRGYLTDEWLNAFSSIFDKKKRKKLKKEAGGIMSWLVGSWFFSGQGSTEQDDTSNSADKHQLSSGFLQEEFAFKKKKQQFKKKQFNMPLAAKLVVPPSLPDVLRDHPYNPMTQTDVWVEFSHPDVPQKIVIPTLEEFIQISKKIAKTSPITRAKNAFSLKYNAKKDNLTPRSLITSIVEDGKITIHTQDDDKNK